MPLGGKYFPTRLKVMHHFRTQHLKPFFGKSMRLAGKEKKGREGKGREGKTNANYGANRAGKAVGKKAGWRKPEGEGEGGERVGGACA